MIYIALYYIYSVSEIELITLKLTKEMNFENIFHLHQICKMSFLSCGEQISRLSISSLNNMMFWE